ncbi:MAG: hypothetical protein OXF27_03905 [Acidobacteria bacterium]|nr:hypothetical protein [Acidobacteriota bacterium]
MHTGHPRAVILLLAVFALALSPATALGQSSGWTAPRTADGHPDLQGVWGNNAVTPLERPESLGDRATLTDEELSRVQTTAEELFALDAGDAAFGDQFFNTALTAPETFTSSDGGTGNYNQFWLVERDFDNRTSLIVDPPNGRLPELTPEAEQAAEAARAGRGQPAAWTDARGLSERCITFGLPNLLAGYNSYYHILQTADHVVIEQELIHTTRIIPLDGRPHIEGDIDQWHGNSVGRWDGDTLVVETRNFSPKSNFRGSSDGLQLVERFTRVGPDDMHYEFTVNDPKVWKAPWTAMLEWKRTADAIFEYACHEGNIGMAGILSGARADEAKAATAGSR